MSKTHEEFLAYFDNIKDEDLKKDDVALELVFEVLDKLKNDFIHLAKHMKKEDDCDNAFHRPLLNPDTHYLAEEYGGTAQDQAVLACIIRIMEYCYMIVPFLHRDAAQDNERTNIQYDVIKQLHFKGYKVFIHLDVTSNSIAGGHNWAGHSADTIDDLEPLPRILVDIGTMLVEL